MRPRRFFVRHQFGELTRTSTLNGHPMEVKWARKEQDLPACQILFVSGSVAKRYDKPLDAVKDSIILTIGEDADFLQAGENAYSISGTGSFKSLAGPAASSGALPRLNPERAFHATPPDACRLLPYS